MKDHVERTANFAWHGLKCIVETVTHVWPDVSWPFMAMVYIIVWAHSDAGPSSTTWRGTSNCQGYRNLLWDHIFWLLTSCHQLSSRVISPTELWEKSCRPIDAQHQQSSSNLEVAITSHHSQKIWHGNMSQAENIEVHLQISQFWNSKSIQKKHVKPQECPSMPGQIMRLTLFCWCTGSKPWKRWNLRETSLRRCYEFCCFFFVRSFLKHAGEVTQSRS